MPTQVFPAPLCNMIAIWMLGNEFARATGANTSQPRGHYSLPASPERPPDTLTQPLCTSATHTPVCPLPAPHHTCPGPPSTLVHPPQPAPCLMHPPSPVVHPFVYPTNPQLTHTLTLSLAHTSHTLPDLYLEHPLASTLCLTAHARPAPNLSPSLIQATPCAPLSTLPCTSFLPPSLPHLAAPITCLPAWDL